MIYNKWFVFLCSNPLKTYNKVKKYWIKPKLYFKVGKWGNLSYPPFNHSNGKIIHFLALDVGWKDKYNSPRFETPPFVSLVLFHYIHFVISWHIIINEKNENMAYWESILDYIYYGFKTPKDAVNNNIWTDVNKNPITPVNKFLKCQE